MKPSDELFQLIKSLTKSEKRYFHVHYSEDAIYQKIFDIIEKQEKYNEKEITENLNIKQPHVYKYYLYKLILKSLRSFYSESSESSIIYNYIQSFDILFSKGLVRQAEKVLTKAKVLAEATNKKFILSEIYQLEQKLIFNRPHNKEELSKVGFPRQQAILNEQLNMVKAQQLAFQITRHFYRTGYLINKEIKNDIESINFSLEELNGASNEFLIYKYWIKYIFHFINGNFFSALNAAERFIQIVDNYETVFDLSIFSVEIAYSHVRCTIKIKELNEYFIKYKTFPDDFLIKLPEGHFAHNSTGLMNLYLFYEVGKYQEGLDYWKSLPLKIYREETVLLIVTYHAAGILHFCLGNYKEALKYCNKVINKLSKGINNDFYVTSLLMRIIIFFELRNFDVVEMLIKKIEQPLKEYSFFHPFDKLLLSKLKDAMRAEFSQAFTVHMQVLNREFEKVASTNENISKLKIYFNFQTWIKSKVLHKEFRALIEEGRLELFRIQSQDI